MVLHGGGKMNDYYPRVKAKVLCLVGMCPHEQTAEVYAVAPRDEAAGVALRLVRILPHTADGKQCPGGQVKFNLLDVLRHFS